MSKKSVLYPINKTVSPPHTDDWNSRFSIEKLQSHKSAFYSSSQKLTLQNPNHLPKIRSAQTLHKNTSPLKSESLSEAQTPEYALQTESSCNSYPGSSTTNPLQSKQNPKFSSTKPKPLQKKPTPKKLLKRRQISTFDPLPTLKPASKSYDISFTTPSLPKISSTLKHKYETTEIPELHSDSDSSDSFQENFILIAQKVSQSLLSDFLTLFSKTIITESIDEAVLAYLTLSSNKVLYLYINEALEEIVPALSQACYDECKEQEPSDLRDLIVELVREEEICRIVKEINLNIVAGEVADEYLEQVPLEGFVQNCIEQVEKSNKKRVLRVLEFLIDSLIGEEWIEILVEDVINTLRIENIWKLFPLNLQKEVGKKQFGKIVEFLAEEVYFDILNNIVGCVWVESICKNSLSANLEDTEDDLPIPKLQSKKN